MDLPPPHRHGRTLELDGVPVVAVQAGTDPVRLPVARGQTVTLTMSFASVLFIKRIFRGEEKIAMVHTPPLYII
jgi:hypothetical protein